MLSVFLSLCFRECKDMRFCRENINKTTPVAWSISNPQVNSQIFTADLNLNGVSSGYSVQIYEIPTGGVRFRVLMPESQSSYRYDILHDDLIVNSTLLTAKSDIEGKDDGDHYTIKTHNFEIKIQKSNFAIQIAHDDDNYMNLNPDGFMFIEDGSAVENEEWDGKIETFPHGKTAVGMSFSFIKDAYLTGLHESTSSLNLPDGEDRRYARDAYSLYGYVPFFFAHHKNLKKSPAVFWMNPSDLTFSIRTKTDSRDVRFISEGGFIDFVVFVNDIDDLMKEYTTLTGRAPLPPAWTLGYQQSKWGYMNQTQVEEIFSNFSAENIPWDVIWLDIDHLDRKRPFTFSDKFFYDREKFFSTLKQQNKTIIRIADPHMAVSDDYLPYKECIDHDYFVKKEDVPFKASCWPGNSSWPDFIRSDVRKWWSSKFTDWAENVYPWNDMNEVAAWESIEGTLPKDAKQLNNTIEVREVHSIYGLSMTKGTFDSINSRRFRPFILTRSFFAGSQKYAWTWSGDNSALWEHLSQSIDSLLTSNLNGQPFTGSDVGGFGSNTTKELLARWYQVGSLIYPLFREHSANTTEYREPYLYKNDSDIYSSILRSIKERYRVYPLLYTSMERSSRKGIPFAAPLFYHYPESDVHSISHQVIVGGQLMVVPVLREGSDSVFVTKPGEDEWYDFRTGEPLVTGTHSAKISEHVSAFIKGGSISAILSEDVSSISESLKSNVTLIISVDDDKESEGELYYDDGQSFDYKTNNGSARISIKYEDKQIEIKCKGECQYAPICDQIVIYGLQNKDVPHFKIDGISTSVYDHKVVISNIRVQLGQSQSIESSISNKTRNIIISISAVFGVIFIIFISFIIQRQLKKNKADNNYESFADEK